MTTTKAAHTPGLTVPEMRVLITAIEFLGAGEWSETINGHEHNAMIRAGAKLRAAIAKATGGT